ncbi:cupredoxin domain-containing protein [Candidatus Poriferisodalis sp.]|uniref:cupredoxin domain-containing protein n=1 Tax=Candidatus Poriferisodalis sp. TaxID=3101277 RepID=UPI003D0C3202
MSKRISGRVCARGPIRWAAVFAVFAMLVISCTGQRSAVISPSPSTTEISGYGLEDEHAREGEQEHEEVVALPEDERNGEVHVHEDGFAHTHGAGAPREWVATYTAAGEFEPERLDILAGDTVTWVNESERGVWPASNIHPTHEILPEFDSLREIPPGESWSFTFAEHGYWRYHNHSDGAEAGLVVVTGTPVGDLAPLDMEVEIINFPVPLAAGGEQIMTDSSALYDYVVRYGPAAAVADLKATELRTGRDCHNAAHEVGQVAFEEFGPAAFVIAGHDCQAGALHGAIEALFAERGTSQLATDVAAVCSASEDSFVMHQCLHGVGHGIMAWTTYELHEALELCDVLPGQWNSESCYSGVFMENVVGGLSGLMGHETAYLRLDDPHFPCDVVEPQYVPGCYFYQTSHMTTIYGGNMQLVAAACAEAPTHAQYRCFASYGRDVGAATHKMPERAVGMCGYAPELYRSYCVNGAVQDRFWSPSGSDDAIALCAVTGTETAVGCWDTIIERAEFVLIDIEARTGFCAKIPDEDARARCERLLLPAGDGS